MANHGAHPSRKRIAALLKAQAEATGFRPEDIHSGPKTRPYVKARWAIWRQLRADNFAFGAIAHVWGCDHTSIMHAERRNWGEPDPAPPPPLTIWGRSTPEPQRRTA